MFSAIYLEWFEVINHFVKVCHWLLEHDISFQGSNFLVAELLEPDLTISSVRISRWFCKIHKVDTDTFPYCHKSIGNSIMTYSHSSNARFLELEEIFVFRLKKTRSMRTLINIPLAINKRLGWRILETEEQYETLLGGQTRFGERFWEIWSKNSHVFDIFSILPFHRL